MKQETNNEMDLLLRRLARRQDVFAPDHEDHLDADELNAYAENALPAKSRTRYTEHVAECSRCRELVVQLSASAGVVIAQQADKVSESTGWRKFLAGLFSPMVLKYAAPALGLIVVALIGVAVLRRNQPGDYVSQVQREQSKPPDVAEGRVESNQQPQPQRGFAGDDKAANSTVGKESQNKDSEQQSDAPGPAGSPASVDQNAPTVKAPAPKPESPPVVTAAEPPPPQSPAKVDAVIDEKRQQPKEDSGRKQEAEVKVTPADDSKKNFEIDGRDRRNETQATATARSRAAKSKSVVGDLSAAQGAAAPGAAREEAGRGDKDSPPETRSVAGRRFRRQGGIWIDTAFDQSRAITTYSRNSESYRSLVADEPAIKTIADELDGEFIVVWKGRTYRIH